MPLSQHEGFRPRNNAALGGSFFLDPIQVYNNDFNGTFDLPGLPVGGAADSVIRFSNNGGLFELNNATASFVLVASIPQQWIRGAIAAPVEPVGNFAIALISENGPDFWTSSPDGGAPPVLGEFFRLNNQRDWSRPSPPNGSGNFVETSSVFVIANFPDTTNIFARATIVVRFQRA